MRVEFSPMPEWRKKNCLFAFMDIGCLMSHIALPLKTNFSYLGPFVTLSDPLLDFLKSPSSSRPKQRLLRGLTYSTLKFVRSTCGKPNLSSTLSFLDARERNLSRSRHGQVVCDETLSIVEVNSLLF